VELKLYRNHLLILLIAIVGILYFLNRLNIINDSEFTEGIVIGQKVIRKPLAQEKVQKYPVVEFIYHGKKNVFDGEVNTDHETGERLTIIIKNKNPKEANIYDFTGFWLNSALFCIIPLLFLSAGILSFVGSERYILLSFGKKKEKSNHDNDSIDTGSSFLKQLQ
jgi:hypothetical protein